MRVAVIGGGFSGMLAAYILEKKGIDVTIYEKQQFIGGHCHTLISKDMYTELGTIFSFTGEIKELLIELQVAYTERFIYRSFVDANFNPVQHMPREDVVRLMEELSTLKSVLEPYSDYLNDVNYGYIPKDLMLPFKDFLTKYNLRFIAHVISPHLSSFGFGCIGSIQAYYVFKVFNFSILNRFIRGEKVLLINKGISEVIYKLSEKITDIRYALEVTNVEGTGSKVKVETSYGVDTFDKVLITTKLPKGVIKDSLYNDLMEKIDTHPFITCAYEVANKDLTTTYFKSHLGLPGKIQFFYALKKNNRCIITAYAYGMIHKELIDSMTHDLQETGVTIKQLITTKQWYIFPHLKTSNLTQSFYQDISTHQHMSSIYLIGSLVSKPSIDNLYVSIKNTIDNLLIS